jgi:hydrogenase maturation protease
MSHPRILVAGIGNIFFGDDGFGVAVVEQLQRRSPNDDVTVVDFGIRGLDLTYALLDGYDTVILVDALSRGAPPGTLFALEPDANAIAVTENPASPMLDPHDLNPAKVLRLVRALGGRVERVVVVGCEPAELGSEEDLAVGLSETCRAAVPRAVELIESFISEAFAGGTSSCTSC